MLIDKGKPVWDPYTQRMVLVPPNVSLAANIGEARKMDPFTWGVRVVTNPAKGGWDYKQLGPPGYRDFGNVNYGATGRAVGFSPKQLQTGGDLYKLFKQGVPQNNARDTYMINRGIQIYDSGTW